MALLVLASVLAFVSLQHGRAFQIAATVLTVMGFIGCTVCVALDLEPRIYGHPLERGAILAAH